MKCRFVYPCEVVVRTLPPELRNVPTAEKELRNGRMRRVYRWPVGYEYEHKDAWKLCMLGAAEPADDECREACPATDEQLAYARLDYPTAELGILIKDRDAYHSGFMLGYRPDGSWIPGPNYEAWLAIVKAEEEDEEL